MTCDAGLRIIGGRDALQNEFPFAIRLEIKIVYNDGHSNDVEYEQLCTGAAVSPKWILSAAHCYSDEGYEIVARYNSHFPKHMGEISPIIKVFNHPQYNEERFGINQNDIALFLSQNILVSQYGKISAVDYMTLVGHKVNILGFGLTNATEEKPLQVLNGMMNSCLENEKSFEDFMATLMCVVPLCGVQASICGGDSGGPVVHSSGIVGVNSRSFDDCSQFTTDFKNTPGYSASIVAMISHELDWISNIISTT
ncbi:serine protease 1-like [Vanessa cardui]|uniref:serine protease 1-like n=1 Tax=Vanessa cardui TaxID=171605 RepID=UPI001F145289|nr:serine protease 1-like [Vanessa cardui]